ncbi:MAG: hypothetical protein NXI24_05925 [bacterium]|nr:hypothetical protein [bacterium]
MLVGLLAAVLLAEATLRLTGYEGDYERATFRFQSSYDTIRKDSWALKSSDACLSDDARETRHALCVNGDAIPLQRSRNTPGPRVLFLGDSGTLGWGVDSAEAFPARMKADAGLTTVNAGVYGFHNFDALRLYQTRLAGLEVDLVVLGIFMANDLNYNLLAGDLRARYPAPIESARAWLLDHSALWHFVSQRALAVNHRYRIIGGAAQKQTADNQNAKDARPAPYSRLSMIDDIGLHLLHYRQGEIAGYRPDGDSAFMNYAYILLEQVLREFKTTARERGARFAVVLLPAPSMIAGEYISPVEPRIFQNMRQMGIELLPGQLDITRPTRRVRTICERIQIACIDPTPALRTIGTEQALLPEDDHYAAAGHQVIAAQIARWIARELR